MRCRRLAPMMLAVMVVGCSAEDPQIGLVTDSLQTELPPAELPTYAKGDSYTFDNPTETWTVVAIGRSQVTWQSSRGGLQSTMFDPLLPPISWQMPNKTAGRRQIVEWSGSLFPLKTGNKLTYKTAVQVSGKPGHAIYVWNCYAGNPRRVTVPAGDFASFPVYCRRNDGRTLHSFYAPALNGTISTTSGLAGGEETVRNLIAFKIGPGARIAAQRPESLPGGWSAGAVAKSRRADITAPRMKPALVATANAPLTFAAPAPPPTTRKPPASVATTAPPARSVPAPARAEAPRAPAPTPNTAAAKTPAPPVQKPGPRRTAALSVPTVRVPPPVAKTKPKKRIVPPSKAVRPPTPKKRIVPPSKTVRRAPPTKSAGVDEFGVHLGSYATAARADRAWQVLGDKHKSLTGAKRHVVYPIDLGKPKGILYRLVAEPNSSRLDSGKLCKRIKTEGGYCRVISVLQ